MQTDDTSFSLTREQVAKMAQCSAEFVYVEIKRGNLKAFIVGAGHRKKLRILREDAIRWITATPAIGG